MNYSRLPTVTLGRCCECPLQDREEGQCGLLRIHIGQPDDEPAPEWCPMRAGPVVLEFKEPERCYASAAGVRCELPDGHSGRHPEAVHRGRDGDRLVRWHRDGP